MNKEVEELLQYLRINISDEDEFIQIASIVITIKQAFSDMEELNNINEMIILMLQFPHNDSFKREFEKLGGGKRKQQILKEE